MNSKFGYRRLAISFFMRIVVLGAGIVGASTAFHLTQLGAEVYLIDRDAPGRATLAGAGIICPWVSRIQDPRYEALSFTAARSGAGGQATRIRRN